MVPSFQLIDCDTDVTATATPPTTTTATATPTTIATYPNLCGLLPRSLLGIHDSATAYDHVLDERFDLLERLLCHISNVC